MRTKTNGRELKHFWQQGSPWWLDDGWVEGDAYVVNGQEMDDNFDPSEAGDADSITILSGVIVDSHGEKEIDLQTSFRMWRKSLTTLTVVVEIPADKLEDLKDRLKSLGGKLSR